MKKRGTAVMLATMLLLSGCALPGLGGPSDSTIRIGTLDTVESEVWGNIIAQMIEHHTDLETELITNLGSSIVQHQAMMNDEVDITSTRYTGTDLAGVLDIEGVTDTEKAMEIVQEEFDQQFNQTWGDSYGFENSYTVSVPEAFAQEHDIQHVEDLETFAGEMNFGVDNAWVNRAGDGYEAFTETHFPFGDVYPMAIGLVYDAAANGDMDAVLGYSSDGRIAAYDLTVLEDEFFPPYDASPVIQNEVVEEHPDLEPILDSLAGTVSTEGMQVMNYQGDVNLVNPSHIAEQFLKENNYFEQEVNE
ncbi:osmoprotectant ABC transporter substrate-binding protein [Salicibibacter halophilus]|uniref:Osmoprotectant ABC transporter substrate-binding protein n=1 Tax=Salicibibacter halophilus TaxID=2502791 RepID=A0A514LMT7_9BACI|nr:osmoprotectant ABC transporter substrate-binding protein [Salicibibacter halophilus]QDI92581.1 osmoprotectant ABC transporter substrate-binding protein [Salicibibacter halophilus]